MKRPSSFARLLGIAALCASALVAVPTAAQAETRCVSSTAAGVTTTRSYSAVTSSGMTVEGNTLAKVSAAGSTVTATVTVTALPNEATCVDLALASYRSPTATFEENAYQTLFRSDVEKKVRQGQTVTLTVQIPETAGTPGTPGPGCTNTHDLEQNGNGANVPGPYDTTCDGSPSGNGNGGSDTSNKPCAGCVGNADNKNPKGQLPGPQDRNAGYECDRNSGIGRGNPAHSGCTTGDFWQIDLVVGHVLPYVGTAPGDDDVVRYGKRLIEAANGGS